MNYREREEMIGLLKPHQKTKINVELLERLIKNIDHIPTKELENLIDKYEKEL